MEPLLKPHGSARTNGPLICCALPLGYGPVAKMAVLAAALRQRDVELVFLGRGLALELAKRHQRLFRDIIAAPLSDSATDALLCRSAGVLSIMDREISARAILCGRPLFVVDSLLWMRDSLPPAWHSAERLWAQNFVGLHESGHLTHPRLTIVGPIVAPAAPRRLAPERRLLINLGGCEEPDGESRYAQFIVDNLRQSGWPQRFGQCVTMLAGQQCISYLQQRYADCGWQFLSLPHDGALSLLDRAELLLTAPGLTTTLEAFERGVPTGFLPPQNYSQWCILRTLRAAGLAPAAFHWEDLTPDERLADRLPEAVRNPHVRQALTRQLASPPAAEAFRMRLSEIADVNFAALAQRQREFFVSLGDSGVETIADQLVAELRTTGRTAAIAEATT